ncbi:esterase/lipase family protein [Caballeronia ptereochthonis]|uniref:PGAP1-like protein n=1 Tax=Caballeronia ptereochthonis TaxID=1777144 RepID=A0A158B3Q0_9BURK|nr:hypothetical protein [Caballeronia ptereochthonis]SAK64758.1 hypothetical protein AWB83_02747 [Caballeronia ptereochthonis]
MTNLERVIPGRLADDGSVHYSSTTSAPDESTAVCYMIPDRVIPIIFVPGVMGSHLIATGADNPNEDEPVWLCNSPLRVATAWMFRGAETRKQKLDPDATGVYDGGKIPSGTPHTEEELRRRGWGTVGKMSYGSFLVWLENALNDSEHAHEGTRARLMEGTPDVGQLTYDEVALSYRYQLPVHAVGYNWLKSNADSALQLHEKIEEFKDFYKQRNLICEKVIMVTHSMGGLVARHYSEAKGYGDNALGIVHGVMPATGAAAAYKRVKSGTEGFLTGKVLGPDAATMTAVFAQSPGPLQLLPSVDYGMGWLKISDGKNLMTFPKTSPYREIYLARGKWWGLADERLINPADQKKVGLDQGWGRYAELILNIVMPFHDQISLKYHRSTYAFYGDDEKFKTWGTVTWKRKASSFWRDRSYSMVPLSDVQNSKLMKDSGTGEITLEGQDGHWWSSDSFQLQCAEETGDGTVPALSGRAPGGQSGVSVCKAYSGIDHEGAYKNKVQQLFTVWALVKILQNVKGTQLEYSF